ncbi:hypothetical protein NHX12_016849 [Muraenolepis orangiensis]|uniref:Uncharacterized protein n=1 Tax=Muraenolepis orangiensis TaxID=630683 RepID=A0A9Q0D3P9_9TELE|nr:hypothetical protein NHX12_016849 [Muraenolepis orangiensis]
MGQDVLRTFCPVQSPASKLQRHEGPSRVQPLGCRDLSVQPLGCRDLRVCPASRLQRPEGPSRVQPLGCRDLRVCPESSL